MSLLVWSGAMSYKRFEDLPVWQAARVLTQIVYRLTRNDTFTQDPGLRQEMRENARSVMNNIAEGFERGSNPEFVQFLGYAKGSAGELRSGSYVAVDQQYVSATEHQSLRSECENVSGQLANFISFLKASPLRGARTKKTL